MSRSIYVNGAWKTEADAVISAFDRGFIFGDAVYEVTCVFKGKLVDYKGHANRLRRSLEATSINLGVSDDDLLGIHRELVRRNNLDEGLVYIQVSRGVADREHSFPSPAVPATIVLFTQAKPVANNPLAETGISVITLPDERWARRDIKTVQLLAPVLAKSKAQAVGADDAWMVQDDLVTEATASTAFIISHDREIVTRELSTAILPGITRRAVIELAEREGLRVVERAFSVSEAEQALEAFTTGAVNLVVPVVRINGKTIGSGKASPIARKLRNMYLEMVAEAGI